MMSADALQDIWGQMKNANDKVDFSNKISYFKLNL